jgi:hypothetical protein
MTHLLLCRYQDLMAGGTLEFTMTDQATVGARDHGCHAVAPDSSILKLPPLRNARNADPLCAPTV